VIDHSHKSEAVSYDLGETVVAPHSSCNLTLVLPPSAPSFRPVGFRIPDEVAPNFLVYDVRVGKKSPVRSDGVFPAELFAESSPDVCLFMDVAPPGGVIVLGLTNVRDRPSTFRGGVFGRTTVGDPEGAEHGDRDLVVGLGCMTVAGGDTAIIKVQVDDVLEPCRLYVSHRVLVDVVVVALSAERDLVETSAVPSSQLSIENISSKGIIELAPDPLLRVGSWAVVGVVNRSDSPKLFCGAVLAHLAR
jgi:hypothetical protein